MQVKMCSVANSTATPVQPTLSSTPSATTSATPTTPSASTTNASAAAAATQRARAGSVSRPHSRSVSGAVAPFAGGFVGSTPVSNDKPVLGSTFGTISGFNVPGSVPASKPTITPEVPYTPEPSVPPLPVVVRIFSHL